MSNILYENIIVVKCETSFRKTFISAHCAEYYHYLLLYQNIHFYR